MLTLLAVCIFGAFTWLANARLQQQLLVLEYRFMIAVADILADVQGVSDSFDAFVAAQGAPADLQPVADALTTLKAKIDAAATPATPPAAPFNPNGTVS